MNVALEDTEEWVAGRLTNRYGDTFLRGNNGVFSFLVRERQADTAVLYISALEDL